MWLVAFVIGCGGDDADTPADGGGMTSPDARAEEVDAALADAGDAHDAGGAHDAGDGHDAGDTPDAHVGDDAGPPCAGDEERIDGACVGTPRALASLALWLRSDRGVVCADGVVTGWTDQSDSGRDAIQARPGMGPRCGAESGELDGDDVVSFAPAGEWSRASQDDALLAVDLTPLEGTFTAIVVARRALPHKDLSFVLGTALPGEVDVPCLAGPSSPEYRSAPQLGWRTATRTTFDLGCDRVEVDVAAEDARVEIVTARIGRSSSPVPVPHRSLWSGTSPVTSGATDGFASDSNAGRIGRGQGGSLLDTRFRGDVAEIIVFDAHLDGTPDDPATPLGRVHEWVRAHWTLR